MSYLYFLINNTIIAQILRFAYLIRRNFWDFSQIQLDEIETPARFYLLYVDGGTRQRVELHDFFMIEFLVFFIGFLCTSNLVIVFGAKATNKKMKKIP